MSAPTSLEELAYTDGLTLPENLILDPMDCGSGAYCNVSVNFYGLAVAPTLSERGCRRANYLSREEVHGDYNHRGNPQEGSRRKKTSATLASDGVFVIL